MAFSLLSDTLRLDDIMQEGHAGEDDRWPTSVRLALVREECEELGMYLEGGRDGKRKWDEMEDREEKDRRPSKKAIGGGEMTPGACGSSHISPGWPVNELDMDLPGELSMNEALLSLPPLTVLKQEAPSPPTGVTPHRVWVAQRRIAHQLQLGDEMAVDSCGEDRTAMPSEQEVCQSGYSPPHLDNKVNGLMVCSPTGSLDALLHSPLPVQRVNVTSSDSSLRDDLRFQYVLAAATSIATKTSEETLTYLNQGQPYEVRLKKLGDLSHYKGKIFKSVIKICFHERRLQYMEKEQMAQWHSERPGERIIEVDVPLSYGLIRVSQPSDSGSLNCVEILWDPTKDAGVYIKVNCISTEFTAKKHGGEKGVPFRVQVETFLAGHDEEQRLHAAACQVKVFKLKGADRKHKQDREKVMRRPRSEVEKYQPGCESTVLTTLPCDAILPPSLISTSPASSPEHCVSATKSSNSVVINQAQQPGFGTSNTQVKIYGQNDSKSSSPCRSPVAAEGPASAALPPRLAAGAGHADTQAWLAGQRLPHHAATFADFCAADLLRLSRDDLIQICGLADGIRLYNALHSKRIEPRLTVYVTVDGELYTAVYLHSCTAHELLDKLRQLAPADASIESCETVLMCGPGGARVYLTDELVRHLADNALLCLQRQGNTLLLTPAHN